MFVFPEPERSGAIVHQKRQQALEHDVSIMSFLSKSALPGFISGNCFYQFNSIRSNEIDCCYHFAEALRAEANKMCAQNPINFSGRSCSEEKNRIVNSYTESQENTVTIKRKRFALGIERRSESA